VWLPEVRAAGLAPLRAHDLELRDRLDTMLAEGQKEAAAASVVQLRSVTPSRDDGPQTAQDNPSSEDDPVPHRILPAGLGGAPPGTRTPNRCLKRAGRRGEDQVECVASRCNSSLGLILAAAD
jgi:hypothetical protein